MSICADSFTKYFKKPFLEHTKICVFLWLNFDLHKKYVLDVVELIDFYKITWIKILECLFVQIHSQNTLKNLFLSTRKSVFFYDWILIYTKICIGCCRTHTELYWVTWIKTPECLFVQIHSQNTLKNLFLSTRKSVFFYDWILIYTKNMYWML